MCLVAAQPWFDQSERQALAYAMMYEALRFMSWLLLGLTLFALVTYLICVIALCRAAQRRPSSLTNTVAAESVEPVNIMDEFEWQAASIKSYPKIE